MPPQYDNPNPASPQEYAFYTKYMRFTEGIAAAGTSLGAGGQIAEALAAVEYHGVSVDTGDEFYFLLDPQGDMGHFDFTHDIQAQVFAQGADPSVGVILHLAIKGVAVGEAISDAKVSPDAAVTFATFNVADLNILIATEYKSLAIAAKSFGSDALLQCALTVTADGDAAAGVVILRHIRFRGTKKLFATDGLRKVT